MSSEKGLGELRPARAGSMKPDSPERIVLARPEILVASKSEAAQTVALMRAALVSMGTPNGQVTTPDDVAELMPFFSGTTPLPDETTPAGKALRKRIALHQPALIAEHLLGIKKWMKKKENASATAEATALGERWDAAVASGDEQEKDKILEEARTGALIPLGMPYAPSSAGANDLPDMPPALRLLFQQEENLAHRARNAFVLGLRNAQFKDNDVGKFCQAFATLLEERNRAHIDAHDVKMRARFDNAALALLSYNIVKPIVLRKNDRNGEMHESVGFKLDIPLLERHAEVFLARERVKRLQKALQTATEPTKTALEQQLSELATQKEDADIFIRNLAARGIKKPATIFETFGNRLYVPASDLPVFATPQDADSSEGKSVHGRSLDAALAALGARQEPVKFETLNKNWEIRAGHYKNMIANEMTALHTITEDISRFNGELDADTRAMARNLLRDVLFRINTVEDLITTCAEEMQNEDATEKGRAARIEVLEPIRVQAGKLAEQYSTQLGHLSTLLKLGGSENTSGDEHELREQNAQLRDTFRTMLTQVAKLAALEPTSNVKHATVIQGALKKIVVALKSATDKTD